jgi:hypothetical protein
MLFMPDRGTRLAWRGELVSVWKLASIVFKWLLTRTALPLTIGVCLGVANGIEDGRRPADLRADHH